MPELKPENPPTELPHAVTAAVSRFWAERGQGRAVSVDDVLETSPGSRDFMQTRATAIQVIASQAAVASGGEEVPASERETMVTVVGQSAAEALASKGPLPQIDGYDLVACLGRGGMGAVFEGYQRSTGRRVAIKFMLDRLGASGAARQRFEREVEVVARLQHPGIVSVIDSGVRKGQYFYVMEFVPGKLLDGAMTPGQCGVREAVTLMANVCDAVEYAHQRGVLHRDLKPSNVIIDEEGLPHLLDFGLAKVFDPTTGDGGTHGDMGLTISGPGQLLGTLAYMATEQAQGRHDQTSVRTDVYALGAITYELITGKLPCPMGGSVAESLARIIEQPPAAPSSLRKGLARDLDAVLLKALEKDPQRRYATAGELAADLRRHLAGEPVLARRVGAAGRTWRWVRRNQAISAVAAAAVVTLCVVSALLVNRIVQERDLARENFSLLKSMLEAADPERSIGVTVVQLLDGASTRLDKAPPERPEAEAEIREIIGGVYRKFMEYDKARDNQVRVLEIREQAAGGDDPAVATAMHNLAATLWWDGMYAEAEGLYRESLEMRKRLRPGNSPEVAMSLSHLAACRLRMGKGREAQDLYQQSLDMRRAMYGEEHEEVAQAINNLARCLLDEERFDEAEAKFRQSLRMIRRLKGDWDRGTAAASQNLGDCFIRRGEAALLAGDLDAARRAGEAAMEPYNRARQIRQRMFADGHHLVAASLGGLARAELLIRGEGSLERARTLADDAVEMVSKTRRPDHPEVAEALETQGLVQLAEGHSAAVATLTRALEIAEAARPRSELRIARMQRELARALVEAGEDAQARDVLIDALGTLRRLRGDAEPETRRTAQRLMEAHRRLGESEAAEGLLKLVAPE